MKRDSDDWAHEIQCVSTILTSLAYGIDDGSEFVDLTKTSAQDILFGCCNYLDRIAEDVKSYDGNMDYRRKEK